MLTFAQHVCPSLPCICTHPMPIIYQCRSSSCAYVWSSYREISRLSPWQFFVIVTSWWLQTFHRLWGTQYWYHAIPRQGLFISSSSFVAGKYWSTGMRTHGTAKTPQVCIKRVHAKLVWCLYQTSPIESRRNAPNFTAINTMEVLEGQLGWTLFTMASRCANFVCGILLWFIVNAMIPWSCEAPTTCNNLCYQKVWFGKVALYQYVVYLYGRSVTFLHSSNGLHWSLVCP